MNSYQFNAIGTNWDIETKKPLGDMLEGLIQERIELFDQSYSRFRPDSIVSRIASAAYGGKFDFPADSTLLFDLFDQLYKATEGAVDPLVGRELELLGYDSTYSLKPVSDSIREKAYAQGKPGWLTNVIRHRTSLITDRPVVIDVGAAGKGYLVDIISEILIEEGLSEFVVDGSGDIRHSGETNIQVGLEHPFDSNLVVGVCKLKNQALCASAVNRRTWGEGLHHIIDARTGTPAQDIVATWVVADVALVADGLATALFFTSGEHLARFFRFSYVRMFKDGQAEVSKNFEGEVFF
ncbi:FAD:protein FMN transferase [Paenibacillus sp. Dod16]|uniref:FAD:protein FMN transferase n=1 Tax=Paenibacillus sp. Dod16 TaxID=3416392 RepID=UPI003CF0160A